MSLQFISEQLAVAGVNHEIVTAKSSSFDTWLAQQRSGNAAMQEKLKSQLLNKSTTSKEIKEAVADWTMRLKLHHSGTAELESKQVTRYVTALRIAGTRIKPTSSEQLAVAGVNHKIITAAESKDPENPPYSRKNNITSLNDKRLLKLLSILDACGGIAALKTVKNNAKSFDVKEAGDFLVSMQSNCDSWEERLRDAFDIVKKLTGKDGVNIAGGFGSVSRTAAMYIRNGDYKTEPAEVSQTVLIGLERVMRHVEAARTKVVKEALKRGIVDSKIDVHNKFKFKN